MKKTFLFFAAFLLATVMNLSAAVPAGTGYFTVTFSSTTPECDLPNGENADSLFIIGNFDEDPWQVVRKGRYLDPDGDTPNKWVLPGDPLSYPADFKFQFVIQYEHIDGSHTQVTIPSTPITFDGSTFDYTLDPCAPPDPIPYVKADGTVDTCKTYTVVMGATSTATWGVASTETWYVVNGDNVTLTQAAQCVGTVHLILADGAKLTATGAPMLAGIDVHETSNSLTIYGQANQTGQLIATGHMAGGAGIGCCSSFNGSGITINGGIITATGGGDAAGIGGGFMSSYSDITINGGTVTAIGGNNTSGIGVGESGIISNIFVNPALILKADNNNPPTTEIAHATITTDVASLLAGKRYATVEPAPGPAKDEKFSAEGNNFVVIGTDPMEVMVDTNSLASGAVVIPDSVVYKDTKLAVTVITSNAFKDNANITSVVVPGTIDSIGEKAFYNCAALKVAKLGEGIKKMGRRMFSETPLDTIYMPSTLGGFKDGLGNVMDIQAIKWYEVADDNSEVASIEGVLVNAEKNTLILFPHGRKATEYTVPAGITKINSGALSDTSLVALVFTDVEFLEQAACARSTKLESVEFSDAIDSIGSYTFASDTMLTTITCPAIVPPALGDKVFADVTLSKITLYVPEESVSAYEAADIWKDMNIQSIATGINQLTDSPVNRFTKAVINGQFIIIHDGKAFNAQGAEVE